MKRQVKLESEGETVKRFYVHNDITFLKNCSKCGEQMIFNRDMFEYPHEGITLYFSCTDCDNDYETRKEEEVELQYVDAVHVVTFDLPDNVSLLSLDEN